MIAVGAALAQGGPASRPIATEGKSCMAAGCHDTLAQPRYLHAPVVANACDQCHRAIDPENHQYEVEAAAPGLCFRCHVKLRDKLADMTSRPHHHKPVDEGKCLDCHEPHASFHPKMLRQNSVVDLCLHCHQETLSLTGDIHKPIRESGCLECHRGHDGQDTNLLRASPEDLCLQCHDDNYQAFVALPTVHEPVREKNCVGCHTPHASPYGNLLAEAFSAERYQPFQGGGSYALCFSCHPRELATDAATVEHTRFRNGDRNLHFVHVNKDRKGRSCRICHQPHGSELARLIRPAVPFGDWNVRIRYSPTETGGYCGVGCHSAKRYDRAKPVAMDREPLVPPAARTGDRSGLPPAQSLDELQGEGL